MSLVVSDTTPLNYLILIGHIDVLPSLFGKLLVPPAVDHEMHHPKAPANVAFRADNLPAWIEVKAPRTELHLGIGAGEDAAILMDDKKARTAAENRSLLTIGTVAILDLADETGLLDFELAISRLQATTFHVEGTLPEPARARFHARKKGATKPDYGRRCCSNSVSSNHFSDEIACLNHLTYFTLCEI